MKKTLAIYLDFDGVLHPTTCGREALFGQLPLLERLLVTCPTRVVVSSSWRHHESFADLRARFSDDVRHLVIGTTGPVIVGKWPRYSEIEHDAPLRGWSDQWVALDDAFLEFPPSCAQLIRCNPNTGLDEAVMGTLRRRLMGSGHAAGLED